MTIKHLIETKQTKNHYKNKIIIGDGLEAMAAMVSLDFLLIQNAYKFQ